METGNHSKNGPVLFRHFKRGRHPKSHMSRENSNFNKMKTNKILLGGLTGGGALFLLGWVIYGIILMDFATANYNQCMNRPMQEMVWWSLILSNLALGFLISTIFSWSGTTGLMAGAKVGGTIGILLSLSMDLSFYSMTTMYKDLSVMFVDIIVYTVYLAIAGAVVGWVMGMGKK